MVTRFARTAFFASVLGVTGCGGRSWVDDESAPSGTGTCNAAVAERAIEGATHVPVCSHVGYQSNPPSSGNHYPVWGAFGAYASPLPRGFWVHNLEHGAIVISHHCPDGCPEDLARAEAFVAAPPADAKCGAARVLLVPDPLLDVRWAASSWGHTLRADCFDADTFRSFYAQHYNHSPEDECSPGQDFRKPDGSLDLPADCGK